MRKSVIFIVMLAAFFSFGNLPAQQYYQNTCCNPCCCIKEGSAAFSLGTRSDDFEWRFRDKGDNNFLSGNIPEATTSAGNLLRPEEDEGARNFLQPCLNPIPNGFCGCDSDDHCSSTFKQKWEHQRMVNLGFRAKVDTTCCVYARLNADYGWICESDFRSRCGYCNGPEFFFGGMTNLGLTPGKRHCGKGHAWDVTAGIGHNFHFCCEQFQFAPVVGWSYHNQDLHTKKAKNQTSCLFTIDFFDFGIEEGDLGVFDVYATSQHKYCARWNGPWIGFDAVWQWGCNLNLYGTFEYHWAKHRGDASCNQFFGFVIGNVTDDPEPEEGEAVAFCYDSHTKLHNHICARGIYLEGGINYDINSCFFVGFDVKYYDWRKLNNGRVDLKNCVFLEAVDFNDDEVVFFSEESEFKRCARVSGLRWESLRFEIKLGTKF